MLLLSCSTVRRLPEGELLYTGTRKVEVVDAPYSPLRDKAVGEAKVAFVSPPNNALFGSSRYRTPLPLGYGPTTLFLVIARACAAGCSVRLLSNLFWFLR